MTSSSSQRARRSYRMHPSTLSDAPNVILRCTARALSVLGVRPASLPTVEAGEDDWYANVVWIERRKCLLLVHAGTLFSVFVPDVRKADLMTLGPAVARWIRHELASEGMPEDSLGQIDAGTVTLARTASRVTLGYMNEMGHFLKYWVAIEGGLSRIDVGALNRAARRQVHLSKTRPGYIVPIELAAERTVAAGARRFQRVEPIPTESTILQLPGCRALSNQNSMKGL